MSAPNHSVLWGHEWAAVAWMASAEYEGLRALRAEVGDSRDGGWLPDRAMWREWIDDYTATGLDIWRGD